MTIQQAQALQAQLENNITALLQQFQQATGLKVHSVPVSEPNPNAPVTAKVKVLL
jgi:hypothetical protein